MMVAKKKILEQWILYAKADLDAAKRLLDSEKPTRWTYLLALWHCHQTIEKGLKMIIIKKEKELLKIHDLQRLSQVAELKLTEEQRLLIADLNGYYLRSRYPDMQYAPLPDPTKKQAELLLNKTEIFFLWMQER